MRAPSHLLLLVVMGGTSLTGCRAIFGSYEKADEEDANLVRDGATDADAADSTGVVDMGIADTAADDTGSEPEVGDSSLTDALVSDTSVSDSFAADTVMSDAPTSDTGTADTGTPETGAATPPSCAVTGDGRTNCGAGQSCCTSLLVTGGTFSRSYDGLSPYTDSTYQATVSDFKLDKYEITVGRFRVFVDAVVAGWTPPAAAGKHTHLNGGGGLNGGTESGWDTAWNTHLPATKTAWDSADHLACNGTWTPAPGGHERQPIDCIRWHQAAAFCIWDGGFLPSEAEWNYAAAGGAEQRVYPWGSAAPNSSIVVWKCEYGGGSSCDYLVDIAPVGSLALGNGKYGQSDLGGNMAEWTLDWHKDPYNETTCSNCAYTSAGTERVIRGGSWSAIESDLRPGFRTKVPPANRYDTVGARCARTP